LAGLRPSAPAATANLLGPPQAQLREAGRTRRPGGAAGERLPGRAAPCLRVVAPVPRRRLHAAGGGRTFVPGAGGTAGTPRTGTPESQPSDGALLRAAADGLAGPVDIRRVRGDRIDQ